jgi:hypothetical protein
LLRVCRPLRALASSPLPTDRGSIADDAVRSRIIGGTPGVGVVMATCDSPRGEVRGDRRRGEIVIG